MRRFITIIILSVFCFSVFASAKDKKDEKKKEAQPVKVKTLLKEARTAIKNSKDQSKAEKNLVDALTRSELKNSERAEILYTAAELRQSVNASENLKAYLKQKYDTLTFFNSILGIYDYALRCDSVDTLTNENGKVKPLYRQKCRDMLLRHRKNLLAGGKFLLLKQKNAEAYPFFEMYLRSMNSPLVQKQVALTDNDSLRYRVEYWATYSAFLANRPKDVLCHIDSAMTGVKDDSTRMALLEAKCQCYSLLADTVNFRKCLYEGVNSFPSDGYFYLHLMDDIQLRKSYDEGLSLSDQMLSKVGPKADYYFSKSLMFLGKNEPDSCIAMSDSVLRINPDHLESLYNKGILCLQKAQEFAKTACTDYRNEQCRNERKQLISMYETALQPLNHLRQLTPDDAKRWALPLRNIYYNLNKGKDFEEMDRIVKKNKLETSLTQ